MPSHSDFIPALLDRWSHGWLCPPSKLQTLLQLHWDTLQMFWRAQEFGSLCACDHVVSVGRLVRLRESGQLEQVYFCCGDGV